MGDSGRTSEVDGAVAILIAGGDIARNCRQDPMWLVGSSNSQGGVGWTEWANPTEMYSQTADPKIWEKTGLTPADMDLACMYDCFTYTVMATMEGFGFCEKGEVGKFFSTGRTTYGGDVVVNPHGVGCPKGSGGRVAHRRSRRERLPDHGIRAHQALVDHG